MTSALLFVLVLGVVAISLVTTAGALTTWLHSTFEKRRG
jgi:hypothetical protein